jgi:PHD/YefM family antitoxin component YafN of YafNO toxin-antitoxin module
MCLRIPPQEVLGRLSWFRSAHYAASIQRCTHLSYTECVALTRVLTMRELRQNLADIVSEVSASNTTVVFAGSHRKPEVVVMSVHQYEHLTLTADQDAALRSTLGTMDMEGQPLSADEQAVLRELIAGRITHEEYVRRLLPEYSSHE